MASIAFRILIITILTSACMAESLVTIDSLIFSPETIAIENHKSIDVNGFYITGDTVYATTNAGIFAKYSQGDEWRKIFDCGEYHETWRDDYEIARKENTPFDPGLLWYDKKKGRYFIFDNHIRSLYVMNHPNTEEKYLELVKPLDKRSTINNFCPQESIFFFGLEATRQDYSVGMAKADLSDYRRIFKTNPDLFRKLALMGDYYHTLVAFNEKDGHIWVALNVYNIIYIVNTNGNLLDSVMLNADDFRLPQPPQSRIKSKAVFMDWASKCSSVTEFQYTSPGYFLLQYTADHVLQGNLAVRLTPTLCWTADGEPVELEVDKLWRMIQTQPDGRVFFARYVRENDAYVKTVVYITRIEP